MSFVKVTKDHLNKLFFGEDSVPQGLFELRRHLQMHGPVNFDLNVEDGVIVAVSRGFVHGSIVTSGVTEAELDQNIKDAILTSFEIPSSYAKEAGIAKFGATSHQYVAV